MHLNRFDMRLSTNPPSKSIDHYNYQMWLVGSVSISVWRLGFKFFSLYFSDEPSTRILISSVFEDPQTITSADARRRKRNILYTLYTRQHCNNF